MRSVEPHLQVKVAVDHRSLGPHVTWSHIPWTVIDQAALSGSNFLIGLFLARSLGIEQFGIFTLGMMVLWFFQNINTVLVFVPMLSIYPKTQANERAAYCGTVVCHQIMLTAGTAALLFFLAISTSVFNVTRIDAVVFASIAAAFVGFSAQDFMRRYFYATARPKLAAQNSMISNTLQIIAMMEVAHLGRLTVALAFVIVGLGSVIAAAIATTRIGPLAFKFDTFVNTTRRHWQFARWQLPSTLAFWVSGNFFYFIAAAFLGPVAVGAMRAAGLTLAASHIILLSVQNHLPPTFSAIWRYENIQAAWQYTIRFALASLAFVAVVSVVVGAAPQFWFHLLFGEEYLGYEWLIYIFILHYLFALVAVIGGCTLSALERVETQFYVQVTTAVVSVFLALLLTSQVGLTGAAVGLVVADVLAAVLATGSVYRIVRSNPVATTGISDDRNGDRR